MTSSTATTRPDSTTVALAHCTALTADGTPCPVRPMAGSTTCFQHSTDPQIAEYRTAARKLGGHRKALRQAGAGALAQPPSLRDRDALRAKLEDTIQQVESGAISPAAGNTIINAVNAGIRLMELEIDTRLAVLELELKKRDGRSGATVIDADIDYRGAEE